MGSHSWGCFVASVGLFTRTVFVGLGQVCLCSSVRVGAAVVLGSVLLSPQAAGLALGGALVATAWPFFRHQDVRLLGAGWYGANGALWGFWSAWFVANPLAAACLTALGATLVAWILDALTFPLGDRPLCLPPLSVPFLIVVAIGMVALPSARSTIERLWPPVDGAAGEIPLAPWTPPPLRPLDAERLSEAWRAYETDERAFAQVLFEQLATEAPDVADAHNGLGWTAFHQGRLEEAERAFRRSIERDTRHPYALDGLGWVAFRRNRLGEAARWFVSARRAAPAWADPHDGLGWVAYMGGRYREAGGHFRRALDHDPAYPDALTGVGWLAVMEGRHTEAQQRFERALEFDPGSIVAREGLGWALAQLGRARDAERAFLDVLRQKPEHEDALVGLATARRDLALRGHRIAGGASEWQALAGSFGWRAVLLAGIGLAIVLWSPWAGLLGVALAMVSAAVCSTFAGPVAVLWGDLHVQTLAMLGLLVAHNESPGLRGVATAATVGVGGVGVWAGLHALGVAVPLLAFNATGLVYLFAKERLARTHPSGGHLVYVFSQPELVRFRSPL